LQLRHYFIIRIRNLCKLFIINRVINKKYIFDVIIMDRDKLRYIFGILKYSKVYHCQNLRMLNKHLQLIRNRFMR